VIISFRGIPHLIQGTRNDFSEVRQYQYGDDIRAIDWNVTARYNEAHVKVFEEERELTMMLMVDISGSEIKTNSKKKILLPRLPPPWLFCNTE
jgi:uncharacterized protein (DUF58 family)